MADVFTFIADGANAPKWRSGVLDVAHVSGKGVGEQWRQGVKGPGGRRIAADYEITAYEPPTLLEFKATAGPVRPSGGYRLEELGAHSTSTQLAFWLKEELSGWKKLVFGGSVQKTMDAEMAALDRLKALLEG
jgi:hypothetical protein